MEEMNYLVYKHTNKENGKCYIGITKDTKDRWVGKGYKYQGSPYFYKAIKKYGWDNFDHEILIEGLTEKEARKKETEYIKLYHSNDDRFGYNLTEGGEHNVPNQCIKDKIRRTQKEKMTPEKRQLLRERALENNYSGENNPFYGKHHNEETRKRMSENQWSKTQPERFREVVRKNLNCGGSESRFAKKIVRLSDGKVFNSVIECAENNNVHVVTVTNHCMNRPKNRKFMYLSDYEKLSIIK